LEGLILGEVINVDSQKWRFPNVISSCIPSCPRI